MVAACHTPSVWQHPPAWREALVRLRHLATELEVLTCSVLPVPKFEDSDEILLEKSVKKFLVGLLENHAVHPWKSVVDSLCVNDRVLISGSLFLARKILPARQDHNSASRHADLMSKPLEYLPPWYLDHARAIVAELFPIGWDKSYFDACEKATPSVSSCLEKSRAAGGVRGLRQDRSVYLSEVTSGPRGEVPTSCEYREVFTSGKYRGVTVTSARHGLLKPLHNIMYDQLSKRDWLLRGDAVPKRFAGFEPKQGEIFVSGDYESATDNLSQAASMVLLREVLRRCRNVPRDMRTAALQSLCGEIDYGEHGIVVQRRGQLMGNYLSFPLLCLHNYTMFRCVYGRSTPVRINGDDIVFRSTRSRADLWAEIVGSAGLKLSVGKTLFHYNVFSLNSTFFRAKEGLPRLIPVIRSMTVWKPSTDLYSLGNTFRRFTKGWGNRKDSVGAFFLRERSREIYAGGRSVTRGLRIPATVGMLRASGLYRRECLYFHWLSEEVPLPRPISDIEWDCVPVGWERVYGKPTRASRRAEILLAKEMIDLAWLGRRKRFKERDWWLEAKNTGRDLKWLDWRKQRRSYRLWTSVGGTNHEFKSLYKNPVNDCMRRYLSEIPTASMVWRRVVKTRQILFV